MPHTRDADIPRPPFDLAETTPSIPLDEGHFRRLIEHAHDLMVIVAPDGTAWYGSPSVRRVLGYDPEMINGRDITPLVHPDDRDALRSWLESISDNPGESHRLEYRFLHADGHWVYLEGLGTLPTDAPEAGIIFNIRDVTERRMLEEALREREEHFRALIENSYDLVQVLDAQGRIAYTGPSSLRLLGYTPEEVAGGTAPEFIHPEDLQHVESLVAQVLGEPGASRSVEYRARHKDGSYRWLETFARTLSPTSADRGLVANARDVTERREAERALRAAKEEAERANLAKSEFLSRMSHELRTPLNSILGFAQILERVEMAAQDRRAVQHILTAGEHLLNLINEVLDIARIESGRQQLSLERVPLGRAIRDAVGLVRPIAAGRSVRVSEVAGAACEVDVRADRQRLTQVLLNVLSNAVKYNHPHGHVRIWCEPAGDDRVRVLVEDTGPGIPVASRDELFVPFARLGAEQSGVEGTGLGLALSRRLVEAMGGAITLASSSEQGSTFSVELAVERAPAASDEVAPSAPARAAARAPGQRAAKLLYVEDNLANMSLIERLLASRPGWSIVPALQGQLGVELAREHAPDLVLLDLNLPDMSGEEVLRLLRADPRTTRLPVIVISADATPATVERLLAGGVAAYLTKPLQIEPFFEAVDAALAAPRP